MHPDLPHYSPHALCLHHAHIQEAPHPLPSTSASSYLADALGACWLSLFRTQFRPQTVQNARVKIGNLGKMALCALLKITRQKHPKNAQVCPKTMSLCTQNSSVCHNFFVLFEGR